MPGHNVKWRMVLGEERGRVGSYTHRNTYLSAGEERTLKLGDHQIVYAVHIFKPCHRTQEITRIGKPIGSCMGKLAVKPAIQISQPTNRPKVWQLEVCVEDLQNVASTGCTDLDTEPHALLEGNEHTVSCKWDRHMYLNHQDLPGLHMELAKLSQDV